MSSIEQKLNTLREIQQSLSELVINLGQDQNIIENELSQMKERWNDSQMEVFKGGTYVGKFTGTLSSVMAKLSGAIDFLEHKYSTLQSHRN